MLVDLTLVAHHWMIILFLLLVIPMIKTTITTAALVGLGLPMRLAATVGIWLGQIGEFSFVLAQLGYSLGVISLHFYQWLIATAALSMAVTPVMIAHADRIAGLVAQLPIVRRLGAAAVSVAFAESVAAGHAILCGFGPIGRSLGEALDRQSMPYTVLELNARTVSRLEERGHPVFYGDGASTELLLRCGLEKARLLAISVPDYVNTVAIIRAARAVNAQVPIIARTRYQQRVQELRDAGATIVVAEEEAVGTMMAERIMALMQGRA